MLMASHVFSRPITVYHVQEGAVQPIVTYNEALRQQGAEDLSVLWSGSHYDALLPVPGSGAGVPPAA